MTSTNLNNAVPATTIRRMSLPALHRYLNDLTDEDQHITYWISALHAHHNGTGPTLEQLTAALHKSLNGQRRYRFTTVHSAVPLPPLPSHPLTSPDILHTYQQALHLRIREVRAAIINAYQANPEQALDLLPPRQHTPTPTPATPTPTVVPATYHLIATKK